MAEVKFGTSGLRGLVDELSDALCRAYTGVFLRHMAASGGLKSGGQVLLGRDLRDSSPRIAEAVAAEIAAQGYAAVNCGAVPTPALALAALERGAPAVMITGSHIPEDRNGLKFYRADGEIDKQDEAAMLKLLPPQTEWKGGSAKLPQEDGAVRQAYHDRAVRFLRAQTGAEKPLADLRIGLYQHSSVSRDILDDILADLGAEAVPFGSSKHFIPVDTEAFDVAVFQRENPRIAGKSAEGSAKGLDAIVSTDGDGDRPLILDDKGDFIAGDIVGIITAQYLGADSVATPITSTSAVEQSFPAARRCRVGSPYVLAAMAEAKAKGGKRIIGFEANGGVLLGSDIALPDGSVLRALPTRDAVLPILCVLAAAQQKRLLLSALRAEAQQGRFTASDRLQNYPQAAAVQFLAALADAEKRKALAADLSAALAHKVELGALKKADCMDGVRLCFASGAIVHFRASGNAPELRCYSEGASAAEASALLAAGLGLARQAAEKACG